MSHLSTAQPDPTDLVEASESVYQIGGRIRHLRRERGLALRTLAQISGLSINTVSLVERNKISPSVNTLHRIAVALAVPITALFEEDPAQRSVIFAPAASRQALTVPVGQMESLGSGLPGQTIEPLLIQLSPGAASGPVITHGGHELVFCVKGSLFWEVAGQRYQLEAGDSLLFEASLSHRWGNPAQTPATALLIFSQLDGPNPVIRHPHG